MLVSVEITKAPSIERLVKLWTDRYTPDLFSLTSTQDPWILSELFEASSPAGRAATVSKLHDSLINLKCQFAGIQTRAFYEYLSNVLDLREAKQVTEIAFQIYIKLLKFYWQSTALTPSDKLFAVIGDASLSAWGIPDIAELAHAIEPMLLELQKQHVAAMDWRTLGFMTTQLNFTNKLLLKRLTPTEQILINPYLKFVEEQVALPWQRVCAAAARHGSESSGLALVEQLMPASAEIARIVYRQLIQQFPQHRSRRGKLDNPDVGHSCLRDLEMFQSYLWLAVLEESLLPIKRELVTLCVMVMESVGVEQELIIYSHQLLMDEIFSRLNPTQQSLLQPYAEGMQQALYIKRSRLGVAV